MDIKRLNLGKSPRVEIGCCDGDLEARGLSRQDIALESDTSSFQFTTAQQTVVVDYMEGSCAIRMPEQGHLRIGSLSGQLTLKGVLGTTEVQHVEGDCVGRHIGSLTVGSIDGDAHLRHTGSPITLGAVGGSATLRDIDMPITITHIGGSFWGRNLPAGLHIEQVDGDLALHTDFAPGSSFQLAVSGDVLFRVPSNATVRFKILRKIAIQVDEGLKIIDEGEQKIIVLGTGAAEVQVSAAASIRVQSDETCDMESGRAFTFDGNIDAYMTDVSAKIDAQMSQIEAKLNNLPDRVRSRIERKLEAAQRKVESALHDAEKAGGSDQYAWCGQVICAPPHEPISEEERISILRMLEKGTITIQEAENLLATLEKER
jgi:hypothetical protein